MRIIDSHVHFWDLTRINPPWLHSSPALAPLATSLIEKDYRAALAGWPIEAAIYLEVDAAVAQQAEEARFATDLCADRDSLVWAAVIGGHPGSEGFRALVANWQNLTAVKGIRQVLQVPEAPTGSCLRQAFVEDIHWLGQQGLSFDLCMRSSELDDGIRLIAACPETAFVLDHCGNPNVSASDQDAWRQSIKQMARLPNVVCKLSGLIESAPPNWTTHDLAPFVLQVLECFGPQRVLFGSNWPVCNLNGTAAAWLEALEEIVSDLSAGERQQIFADNAVRVYRMT
jgi:L-fuconolactonase